MLGPLGPTELLIILAIVVVLFGASRLAGLGGALGRGIREFREESTIRDEEKKKKDAAMASSDDAAKKDA